MRRIRTVAAIILMVCFLLSALGCEKQAPEHEHVSIENGKVKLPLSRVDDHGVHFFTYPYQEKNINFFIRTDGKGNLQAHFDACYSCFKYKLGYVWDKKNNQVVCIACQLGYNLDDVIWDYIGACAPINLKSHSEGEFLIIEQEHLEKGERFF